MSEADDVAGWVRVMVSRYGLGDVEQLIFEGEAMTVAEQAESQMIFEKLAHLEAMTGRAHTDGERGRP